MSITGNWLPIANDHVSALVNTFASRFLGGVLDTESVRPAATGLSSGTLLVFPILLFQENYIYAPDDHRFAVSSDSVLSIR